MIMNLAKFEEDTNKEFKKMISFKHLKDNFTIR